MFLFVCLLVFVFVCLFFCLCFCLCVCVFACFCVCLFGLSDYEPCLVGLAGLVGLLRFFYCSTGKSSVSVDLFGSTKRY